MDAVAARVRLATEHGSRSSSCRGMRRSLLYRCRYPFWRGLVDATIPRQRVWLRCSRVTLDDTVLVQGAERRCDLGRTLAELLGPANHAAGGKRASGRAGSEGETEVGRGGTSDLPFGNRGTRSCTRDPSCTSPGPRPRRTEPLAVRGGMEPGYAARRTRRDSFTRADA